MVGLLVAMVVALPMFLLRFGENWELIRGVLDVSAANLGQRETTGGGTFFALETYLWVSLAYQPFALVGAAHMVKRRLWSSCCWSAPDGFSFRLPSFDVTSSS